MPPLPLRQDYALWLALLRAGGEARGLDEVLADYRVGAGSLSGSKLRAARGTWPVLRREGLPLPRALWCFGHYALAGLRRRARDQRRHRGLVAAGRLPSRASQHRGGRCRGDEREPRRAAARPRQQPSEAPGERPPGPRGRRAGRGRAALTSRPPPGVVAVTPDRAARRARGSPPSRWRCARRCADRLHPPMPAERSRRGARPSGTVGRSRPPPRAAAGRPCACRGRGAGRRRCRRGPQGEPPAWRPRDPPARAPGCSPPWWRTTEGRPRIPAASRISVPPGGLRQRGRFRSRAGAAPVGAGRGLRPRMAAVVVMVATARRRRADSRPADQARAARGSPRGRWIVPGIVDGRRPSGALPSQAVGARPASGLHQPGRQASPAQ